MRSHANPTGHLEHLGHGLARALSLAGEIYADALLGFAGNHQPEHWELVLAKYEREHPDPDTAA